LKIIVLAVKVDNINKNNNTNLPSVKRLISKHTMTITEANVSYLGKGTKT